MTDTEIVTDKQTEIEVQLPLFDEITDQNDKNVSELIGDRIGRFSDDLKNDLKGMGYDCKIKVDISFGHLGELK